MSWFRDGPHSPPFKGGVAAQRPGWLVKSRSASCFPWKSDPYAHHIHPFALVKSAKEKPVSSPPLTVCQ